MNAPACRYCSNTIPIPNHKGGMWCSGCLMDWAPRGGGTVVVVAFDVTPLRRSMSLVGGLLAAHEVRCVSAKGA